MIRSFWAIFNSKRIRKVKGCQNMTWSRHITDWMSSKMTKPWRNLDIYTSICPIRYFSLHLPLLYIYTYITPKQTPSSRSHPHNMWCHESHCFRSCLRRLLDGRVWTGDSWCMTAAEVKSTTTKWLKDPRLSASLWRVNCSRSLTSTSSVVGRT